MKNTPKTTGKNGRDNNGKFSKGNPGRPAGTPNKSTKQIKELLAEFVGTNVEDIQTEYNKLDSEKKLYFLEKVLKYVLPSQTKSFLEFETEPQIKVIRPKRPDNK
ncbi:MAG: hypothetical protein PF448_04130 [Bacteroidales bacterium]|jgi:hypothetical protein|nr:hypothetical protein [Bacteroidales bacterium]